MLERTTISADLPIGEVDRKAIETQLERLLQDPHFSHSRRFPTFLRFVVGSVLDGKAELLKERTIGIEVFGKDAGYETTADPIVRVTAAEIRKRIALYYQQPLHQDELRLSLPSGSYVPQFQWPTTAREEVVAAPAVPLVQPGVETEKAQSVPREISWRKWAAATVALCAIAICAGWWYWNSLQRSSVERFWGPILSSSDPVLFCIADQNQFSAIALRDAANPNQEHILQDKLSAVVIDDVTSLVHIAGLMDAHGHRYHLRGEAETTLTDLREGPTVFVGAFDNAWTLRLANELRFHFGNDPDMMRFWIADRQFGDKPKWVVDRHQQELTNNYRDYGIVAKFRDASTGKTAVIVAGIARGGTIAAGEFVTEPANLDLLASKAPKGWEGRNMEIVISTEIIDGRSAPPKIEAVHFW
jgi:hypothetical protein